MLWCLEYWAVDKNLPVLKIYSVNYIGIEMITFLIKNPEIN